jgi:Ca-activated chloride channel family protein
MKSSCFILRRAFLFLSLVTFFAAAGLSQTPTPSPKIPEEDEVVKVNSRLVVIPVSVTDASGQPVTGLTAKDFRVLEDGKQQEIDQVGNAEKVPLEIALLVDVSGSVNPLFDFEKEAAAQFLQSVMKPDDHATIFLIGDKPQSALVRENSTQAAGRLATFTLSGKFTAFYDTVLLAADFLQKNAPVKSRKVILALTDGEDNWSDITREAEKAAYRDVDVNTLTSAKRNELAATTDAAHKRARQKILVSLQNADTVFYAINPAGGSFKLNKISQRAQTGMQAFADETGGTAFLPNFQPLDTKDALQNSGNAKKNEATLEQIFRQLANELRAQYLVQYYSETEYPNNKFVKLDISLQAPAGRRVRARQGYYAKN